MEEDEEKDSVGFKNIMSVISVSLDNRRRGMIKNNRRVVSLRNYNYSSGPSATILLLLLLLLLH